MSRDHWDAILASAPLNATAGRVTAKGWEYTPDIAASAQEWDGPPEIVRPSETHLRNPCFVDLTGVKYGRLVVLGMMQETSGNSALWVCRCACGKYVGRRAKAIKTQKGDRCVGCDHTRHLAEAASGNNARTRAESEAARKW